MNDEKWKKYVKVGQGGGHRASGEQGGRKAIGLIPFDAKIVLEAGAGNGSWAELIALNGHEVIAVDLLYDPLKPTDRPNITFVQGDIHELPIDTASVDAIYCAHTFEHLIAPYIALMEFNRVLKSGGSLIILTPLDLDHWHLDKTHVNICRQHKLISLADKTGFIPVQRIDNAGEDSYAIQFKKIRDVEI